MTNKIILETTDIEGIYWVKNYYAQTGDNSFTLVANEGPLVTDIIHYKTKKYSSHFLSIGQENRYTFFGDPSQEITAIFVDCRLNSPTLHKKIKMTFKPDPTRHLFLDKGISEYFENIENITVRTEPILYSSNIPNGYNIGEDTIAIPFNTNLEDFPAVVTNNLPLPPEALQFLLKREQEVLKSKEKIKHSLDIVLNNKSYRLSLSRHAKS